MYIYICIYIYMHISIYTYIKHIYKINGFKISAPLSHY